MQRHKIHTGILIAVILTVSSCGLDNNVITTIKSGGTDDDGYMPTSVSRVDTTAESRTVLGERLLLSWLCTGTSLSEGYDGSTRVSDIFDRSEVRIFEETSTTTSATPLFIGTVPAESNNKSYCLWAVDADTGESADFSIGDNYTWDVRLSAGPAEAPTYTGPWGGPYSLSFAETEELESEGTPGVDIPRNSATGVLPSLWYSSDGSDLKAAYLSGTTTTCSLKFRGRSGDGSAGTWDDGVTSSLSYTSYPETYGDTLKIIEDGSGTYHILSAVSGTLEYFTSADGTNLDRQEFGDGNDSLPIDANGRPSFAHDGTELTIVYYTDSNELRCRSSSDLGTSYLIASDLSTDVLYVNSGTDSFYPCFSRLLAGDDGTLHLIYSETSAATISYMSSTDQGNNWDNNGSYTTGDDDYYPGLDAAFSSDGTRIYVGFISRTNSEDASAELCWVEIDPSASSGEEWGVHEVLSDSLWMGPDGRHNPVDPRIRLDSEGIPHLSAVLTTAGTPSTITDYTSDAFPIPKIALFKRADGRWSRHWFDLSKAHLGLDHEGRDYFQFDWRIDSSDVLHMVFHELTWSDESFGQDYFLSNPDLLKLKYSRLDLSSLGFEAVSESP